MPNTKRGSSSASYEAAAARRRLARSSLSPPPRTCKWFRADNAPSDAIGERHACRVRARRREASQQGEAEAQRAYSLSDVTLQVEDARVDENREARACESLEVADVSSRAHDTTKWRQKDSRSLDLRQPPSHIRQKKC